MPATAHREAHEFVMGFVAASDDYRSQYIDRWQEVLANFMVEPQWQPNREKSPYRQGYVYKTGRLNIVLKDPETHKLVMAYLAKLMRALFGDPRREYVQAAPRGWEDAARAMTTTKLLRYGFGLPGTYRSFQETMLEMLLFGTGVLESPWRYEEREVQARSLQTDGYGNESSTTEPVNMPVYDDIEIKPVSLMDFYPDPSRYRIQDMCGAAKRFRMNRYEGMRMASGGLYESDQVRAAFEGGRDDPASKSPVFSDWRRGMDQPTQNKAPNGFREKIGFEYWGIVPYDAGERRMVVTIINNEVVREEPFPLSDPSLPFHSMIVNPVAGRFYGVSPAEVVRFDQSFADALKILLAEAVIRKVHPPIIMDTTTIDPADVAAVKAWKTDAIIAASPTAVGTIQYGADIAAGMGLMSAIKDGIQESSGARGAIQGDNGPNREAATAAAFRVNAAMDQPELIARLLEEDCLPPIGLAMLRRYQQFLESTDDLAKRVGELPVPVWLGDIMGDFDVSFSGSRSSMSRQQKIQAVQALTAMAGTIPQLQAAIPWDAEEIARLVGDILELPDLAAKIGNPATMIQNLKIAQLLGGKGVPSQPGTPAPSGLLPAQVSGSGP